MVAPGMLQNPSVRNWLGGIVPAWTLLEHSSFNALLVPPTPAGGAIRLAVDFSPEEIRQSAVARNALVLLHSVSAGRGLKLTATGNLSRSVVAEMIDLFTWPGFDKTEVFQFHNTINEPDFVALHFVRHLVETGGLVRQRKGYLKITSTGHRVLEDPARHALQALLVHVAQWAVDLGYFGRGLHGDWPQSVNSLPTVTPFSRPIVTPLGGQEWAYPRSAQEGPTRVAGAPHARGREARGRSLCTHVG